MTNKDYCLKGKTSSNGNRIVETVNQGTKSNFESL